MKIQEILSVVYKAVSVPKGSIINVDALKYGSRET